MLKAMTYYSACSHDIFFVVVRVGIIDSGKALALLVCLCGFGRKRRKKKEKKRFGFGYMLSCVWAFARELFGMVHPPEGK